MTDSVRFRAIASRGQTITRYEYERLLRELRELDRELQEARTQIADHETRIDSLENP